MWRLSFLDEHDPNAEKLTFIEGLKARWREGWSSRATLFVAFMGPLVFLYIIFVQGRALWPSWYPW